MTEKIDLPRTFHPMPELLGIPLGEIRIIVVYEYSELGCSATLSHLKDLCNRASYT